MTVESEEKPSDPLTRPQASQAGFVSPVPLAGKDKGEDIEESNGQGQGLGTDRGKDNTKESSNNNPLLLSQSPTTNNKINTIDHSNSNRNISRKNNPKADQGQDQDQESNQGQEDEEDEVMLDPLSGPVDIALLDSSGGDPDHQIDISSIEKKNDDGNLDNEVQVANVNLRILQTKLTKVEEAYAKEVETNQVRKQEYLDYVTQLGNEKQSLEAEVQRLKSDHQKLVTKLQECVKVLKVKKNEVISKETQLSQLKELNDKNILQMKEVTFQMETEKANAKREAESNIQKLVQDYEQKLKRTKEDYETKLTAIKNSNSEYKSDMEVQYKSMEAKCDLLQKENNDYASQMIQYQEMESQVKDLQKEKEKLSFEISTFTAKHSEKETEMEGMINQSKLQQQQQYQELNGNIRKLEDEKAALQKKESIMEKELSSKDNYYLKQFKELNEKMKSLEKERNEHKTKRLTGKQEIIRLAALIDGIKGQGKDMENQLLTVFLPRAKDQARLIENSIMKIEEAALALSKPGKGKYKALSSSSRVSKLPSSDSSSSLNLRGDNIKGEVGVGVGGGGGKSSQYFYTSPEDLGLEENDSSSLQIGQQRMGQNIASSKLGGIDANNNSSRQHHFTIGSVDSLNSSNSSSTINNSATYLVEEEQTNTIINKNRNAETKTFVQIAQDENESEDDVEDLQTFHKNKRCHHDKDFENLDQIPSTSQNGHQSAHHISSMDSDISSGTFNSSASNSIFIGKNNGNSVSTKILPRHELNSLNGEMHRVTIGLGIMLQSIERLLSETEFHNRKSLRGVINQLKEQLPCFSSSSDPSYSSVNTF